MDSAVGTLDALSLRAWESVLEHVQEAAARNSAGAAPPTWTDLHITIEHFDPQRYLDRFAGLLDTPAARRHLTRCDPLLFALVYLRRHLRDADGNVTFADPHLDWFRQALDWAEPATEPRQWRHAYVAPRSCGKSTFWYLLIPAWAAAHGYVKFIAAFSDSATQAQTHLSTLKHEFDTNDLLRADYPDLCAPARRPSGSTIADNQAMLYTKAGFVFAARGIDSAVLGLKVGERRPDVLLLDDVEDDESSYSAYQAEKRLRTIQDSILALNDRARVAMVGTVTMPGSIVHQLVRAANGEEPEPWILEENFTAHHYPPIIVNDDGTERSTWPTKWPMSYLQEIRHTRSFKKNFQNDPLGTDGGYWVESDFVHGDLPVTAHVLSIDPAVTTKKTSDYTGIAIIGFSPPQAERDARGRPIRGLSRCIIEEAWEVRLTGDPLRKHVMKLLTQWPTIRVVRVESNQGGENWYAILHDLPVKLIIKHESAKKEVRAANCLNLYQRKRVVHRKRLVRLEEQMCGFPKGRYDDMVDSVTGTVLDLLVPSNVGKMRSEFPR